MNLIKKADCFLFQTKVKAQKKFHDFLYDEKGDTNFISIMVLLGIGMGLAAIFLAIKDDVMGWVNNEVGDFFSNSKHNTQWEDKH